MKRRVSKQPVEEPAADPPEGNSRCFSSGSLLLDLVLGGGWACGRVVNLVGDKSTGKTLLAIEAAANIAMLSGPEYVRYAECEAAFDESYARTVGLPEGILLTSEEDEVRTVEDFFKDLDKFLSDKDGSTPSIYILDSLDALSNEAELKRDLGEGTYGMEKQKMLSQAFRRKIKELEQKKCTLFIVSQIRDAIGVMFGETKRRSGGKALDFYASQIVWLSEIQKIKRTVLGENRITGIVIKARAKKNKIGLPFREAEMTIVFSYGVDDEVSIINWLKKTKAPVSGLEFPIDARGRSHSMLSAVENARQHRDRDTLRKLGDQLRDAAIEHWANIEAELEPPMRKYEE